MQIIVLNSLKFYKHLFLVNNNLGIRGLNRDNSLSMSKREVVWKVMKIRSCKPNSEKVQEN